MPQSRNFDRPQSRLLRQVSVPTEVDLHHMRVRDALDKLDRYLDDAAVAGIPWVRIIHGKGAGTLKRAVLDHIADHPLVESHEPASPAEGGGGVTIAKLT